MKRKWIVLAGLLFVSFWTWGQTSGTMYWVQFKTKSGTPFSVSNPSEFLSERAIQRREMKGIAIDSTDLPVNPAFVDSLRNLGFRVKHTSRWMNGAVVEAPALWNDSLFAKPSFIDTLILRKDGTNTKSLSMKFAPLDSALQVDYAASYQQVELMGGVEMHQHAQGEGVHVAVIDAGFYRANTINALQHLFSEGRILGTYDFVNPGNDVYAEHDHGANVLSLMAAYAPGSMIGTAPKASYWLLRSEDVYTEYPVEEDYWMVAVEFADSVGCDVINTSLGYHSFDNSALNHSYEDFDGNTLLISKCANLAVAKGMVLVCSAGNERNNSWGKISAPAEAEDVLAVAAVNSSGFIASFSSPGFEGRIPLKPDVSAMGVGTTVAKASNTFPTGSGTSYASPLLAGMVACLVQLAPTKTAFEISDWVRQAGDRYPNHSLDFGYGVPHFPSILKQNKLVSVGTTEISKTLKISPNPFQTSFQIELPKGFSSFQLFNLQGKLVFSSNYNSYFATVETVDAAAFVPRGMYVGVLVSEQGVSTQKLMKE